MLFKKSATGKYLYEITEESLLQPKNFIQNNCLSCFTLYLKVLQNIV